jgi:hypothetical protein
MCKLWTYLQYTVVILLRGIQLGVSRKSFFSFDELEIPTKFYPNFVEISMFQFSEIRFRFKCFDFSKFRFLFQCRNWNVSFDFDCLLATKSKFRRESILISSKISMSKSDDIGISILISISESAFRFRHRNSDFGTTF